jgi:biotin carboxylase
VRLIVSYDASTPSVFALSDAADGLCDIIWMIDLSDPEMAKAARLLRRLGTVVDIAGLSPEQTVRRLESAEPTGIIAVNDSRMTLLAEIASGLGLAFHSPLVAERLSDKKFQRQALRDAGLLVPPFVEIPSVLNRIDAETLAGQFQYPAVLKPRRGDGSRNVQRVQDAAHLVKLVSGPGTPSFERSGWMLEGFLDRVARPVSRFADVVSVESFVHDGSIHHLAVTGRFPFADPFRETGSVLPSDIAPTDADAAMRVASAAIAALGIDHGCHHTELKFTPEGPCIVEVNGRIGGGIPELLALAGSGVNLFRLAMELALGMPVRIELPLRFPSVGFRRIAVPPVWASRISSMEGQDGLKDLPGVADVAINRLRGDVVDWHLGLEEFVYSVYGSAPGYDEVEECARLIDTTVTIEYDEALGGRRAFSANKRPARAN